MTVRCTPVRAADALPALADAVRELQGDSPLTPVTVVVPTNAVGVTARRWLGANGGVAAIELVTPARLAERLAGAELAADGRRPVSTPLLDITVRAVLAAVPGAYAEVAEHPSTVTSLRDLHRELRRAGPAAAERLAGASVRGSEAARISSMVSERLERDWYDEADLLVRAIERVDADEARLGRVIALLPRPESGLVTDLLTAAGRCHGLHAIVEITGVPAVDEEVGAFVDRLGGTLDVDIGTSTAEPASASILSTSDADDEVRNAVRAVVDAARHGTPFARMAIVWPVDRPYARLVEHHLDVAGVPWNGRPGTLATERLVPRFLLDLLDLDRRGLRRSDLFDFLADVPVAGPDGRRVSVARWERIARSAGVSRDDHWQPRLARFATAMRARETPRDIDAEVAEQLASFVDALRRDLGERQRTRSWRDWAEWCERQVLRRLGAPVLDQLDEAERLASDHTSKVLDRLRHLDGVSAPVTRSAFRAAFAAEFDVAPGRLGRLGTGVTIGSLAGTAGLDADFTIVLGAADGLLPPAPVADPLVSDADRTAAGLISADARVHRVHRSFLGHLTTSQRVLVGVPRGDLRATSDRLPSRWIAAHVAAVEQADIASHHAGLVRADFPSSDGEHRLRDRAVAALGGPDELRNRCADDVVAHRGLVLRAARRSDRITVYDGDLSNVRIDHLERPMSPSQIEAWPACPHAYFVRYLLGVRPLDEAADELALSPMERGNVVHETLDRFHRLVTDGALPQPGTDGWVAEHVTAVGDLFDSVADEFERSGRTGRAAHWFLDRHAVRDDLLTWFVLDGRTAADRGSRIVHSELRFGYDEPVTLPLPDGRRLPVAGFIDRVDESADGLVVMDHKTGRADTFAGITADDPTEGATKFQLPVYAAGALSARGERAGPDTTPVRAEYDFFAAGGYARHGYTFDEHVWERVTDDLGTVVEGIESGLFPNVTDAPKFEYYIRCHYCQPDGLGVDERYREWAAKRSDDRIVRWFPPAESEADDGR